MFQVSEALGGGGGWSRLGCLSSYRFLVTSAYYRLKEDNLSLEEIYRVIQPNLYLQAGLFLTLDLTPVLHSLLESLERLPHLRAPLPGEEVPPTV